MRVMNLGHRARDGPQKVGPVVLISPHALLVLGKQVLKSHCSQKEGEEVTGGGTVLSRAAGREDEGAVCSNTSWLTLYLVVFQMG